MTEKILVSLSSGRTYEMRRATFGLIREAENFILNFGQDFDFRKAVSGKSGLWGRITDEFYWRKTRRAWMSFCRLIFAKCDSGLDAENLTVGDMQEIKKNFSLWQAVSNQNGREKPEETSVDGLSKAQL